MAVSKYIIRTRKNRIFEYYLDSVDKVLDTYIKEVLGFNKRFKISEEPWINVTNAIKRTSFKVALINGLCRTPDDNIVDILIEQFAYPCEVPNNGFVYEVSNDLTYFTVKKYTGTNTTVQIPDNCGGLPVTKLATEAFKECEHITELLIPESLTELDSVTLNNCASLETIYFEGTHEQWDELLTGDIPASVHIFYNHKQAHMMSTWISNENGTHTRYCLNEYPEGVTSCIYTESDECSYGDWVVEIPPTCSQEGLGARTCEICGSQTTSSIPKLDHIEGEAKVENEKAPTCEKDGSYDSVIYCAICGEELSRKEAITDEALGHTPSTAIIENTIEADCKNNGSYDEVVYCSVCAKQLSREEKIIPATGAHVYATEIERKDATCTEAGYKIMACSCGESERIEISALGHIADEPVVENEITATCKENGAYDEVTYCSICREELSRKTVITTTSCVPGQTKQIYVEEPTCSTTGSYYVEVECAYCSNILSTSELFEAPTNPTAHVDNNNDGICDLCGEILLNIEEIGTCGDQLTYTRYDDGTLSIQGEGTMYDYTATGDTISPFRNANIARIIIKPGVSSIGNYAFYGCDEIVSVELSEDLTHIGYNAFQDCVRLASLDMSKCCALAEIPYAAFRYCSSLTSVSFPESLRIIDQFAFDHCIGFISVELPEGLEEIGRNSFSACTNLVSINIPSTCKAIDNLAFASCESLISIELPKSCALSSTVFAGCTNLTEVVLPKDLTMIREGTFSGCSSLYSIEIPESVKIIEPDAFYGCSSLASINLSKLSLLSNISGSVFKNCTKLTTVKLPENLQGIYTGAFSGCSSLTSITLPEGITRIASSAFEKCSNLTMINFPDSITSIEAYAFDGCSSLTSVDLSKNTNIQVPGKYIFRNCSSLTTVKLPETLTRVSAYMFYNCKCLASVEVPELVTSIENYAFCECRSLISVVLPESVTEIGENAFENCVKLASVHLPSTLTIIKKYTFNACHELTTINLPETLTEIGEMAFDYCKSLVSIVIPENVTSIGKEAFRCCFNLESITLPTNLQNLGESAFLSCSALTSIVLPTGLTKIEGYTFQKCTSLRMITIPVSIKSIGTSAFINCTALITVNYGGTEYQWMDLTNSMGANNTPLTTAIVNYQYNI